MNMSISSDLMSATISPPQPSSSPPPSQVGKEDRQETVSAVQTSGNKSTIDAKNSLKAGVAELQESGASFADIKSYVNSELKASDIDEVSGPQRSGYLIYVEA